MENTLMLSPFKKRWCVNLWFAVPVILALSGIWHFLFTWTQSPLVGMLSPISESPAEHLKIVFYPILLWWLFTYLIFRRRLHSHALSWFGGGAAAASTAVVLLTLAYNTVFLGLGAPDEAYLHIIIEIIIISAAIPFGLHMFNRTDAKGHPLAAIMLAAAMAILMAIFTFVPPKVPFFVTP